MRPTPGETTTCRDCGESIFLALTINGEWQALDAESCEGGSVMAYRADARLWLARTLPRQRPAAAGELLALEGVGEDPLPRRERPPHPLERPFQPHGETCSARRAGRGTQGDLFGVPGPAGAGGPRLRRHANQSTPREIYNVKSGAPASVPTPREGGAKVYEWERVAPRIAARRRRAAGRRTDAGTS